MSRIGNILDFRNIAGDPELAAWRSRAITIILVVLAVTGLPAYASVVFTAIRRGVIVPLEIAYVAVYVILVILALLPRVDYRLRVWGLIWVSYVNAMASFMRLGLVGSGRLWLVTIPVIATVIIGSRAGYATGMLSLCIYTVFSVLASKGILGEWLVLRDNPLTTGIWIEGGAALLVFISILIVMVERFVSLQGKTLADYRTANVKLTDTTKALQESEGQLRAIGDNLPGGMIYQVMLGPDGKRRFTYMSAGVERLHGCKPEQVLGDPSLLYNKVSGEDIERMIEEEKISIGRMSRFDMEVRFRSASGAEQWSRIVSQPRKLDNGDIVADGIELDITESKRSESALRESEAKYRALTIDLESKVAERTEELEQMNDILVRTNRDLEKTLAELSSAQSQLVQSEKLAALGQFAAGIAHELNTPLGAIASSIRSMVDILEKKMPQCAHVLPSFSGMELEVFFTLLDESLAQAARIDSLPDRKLVKDIEDILRNSGIPDPDSTAKRIADMGAHGLKEKLVDLLHVGKRGEVLSAVEMLSAVRRLGEVITVATDKAANVVRALQNYLKQDEDVDFSSVHVNRDIDTILTLFHNKIKHGIAVHRNYLTDRPVIGNRDRLNQLWINLLNNAFHAMNWQGSVEIEIKDVDDRVSVSIIDSGHGIPAEIRDRIFEPFYTTKKYGEGMGLGLDICKKIVETHKGKMEFESVPGRTRFTVLLKRADS